MNIRKDTYTGGFHYWIDFRDGQSVVLREMPDPFPENEVMFAGHYEKCLEWIENEKIRNGEFDRNL